MKATTASVFLGRPPTSFEGFIPKNESILLPQEDDHLFKAPSSKQNEEPEKSRIIYVA